MAEGNRSVLGPGGYSKAPYASFSGKSPSASGGAHSGSFSVLGPGGYPRPLYGSFAGKISGTIGLPDTTRGSETVLTGVGRHFSRKRYDEILAAERAIEAAEAKARLLKKKQKEALQAAAGIAEEAVTQASLADYAPSLEPLTRALRGITNTSQIIARSAEITRISQAMIREMEEDEDESIIMLLLS